MQVRCVEWAVRVEMACKGKAITTKGTKEHEGNFKALNRRIPSCPSWLMNMEPRLILIDVDKGATGAVHDVSLRRRTSARR